MTHPTRPAAQLAAAALVALAPTVAGAAVAARFDFNSNPPDGSVSTGTLAPSVDNVAGTPAVSFVGGTTGGSFGNGFVTGDSSSPTLPNNRSSDPATADGSAFLTVNYPAQGTSSGTAGFQLSIDLTNYAGNTLSFDQLAQNSASRFYALLGSTDGGASFSTLASIDAGNDNTWRNGLTFALDPSFDNAADAAFRVVSVFAPGSAAYAQNGGTIYSPTNGQVRYDYLTVSGTAVPEPTAVAALVAGGGLLLRRRR